MPTPFGNALLTMMCSLGNTFMSDGTINKDAEISEHERGTPVIVAWHQHGGSGGNPRSRLRHLVAPSLPIVSETRERSAVQCPLPSPRWQQLSKFPAMYCEKY